MTIRDATIEKPYPYILSGLKDVMLAGIKVRYCPGCDAEGPIIPAVASLHRVIADNLVRQSKPLRGDQIRFLRKNAGFSGRRFAALIRVHPSHLSRVENGRTHRLGPSVDLLTRALAVAEISGGEETRRILLGIAKRNHVERSETRAKAKQPLLFKLRGNRWTA
jgi:transcriptional regulator with XRE-family HTH domain